jgi:hypothetical protein
VTCVRVSIDHSPRVSVVCHVVVDDRPGAPVRPLLAAVVDPITFDTFSAFSLAVLAGPCAPITRRVFPIDPYGLESF